MSTFIPKGFRDNPIQIGEFFAEATKSAADAADFFGLSEREIQVLDCLAMGMTGPQAAKQMGVTVNTFNTYKSRCIEKLGVRNVTMAVSLIVAYCCGAVIRNANA